jgi:DNA-directed RNA polymerase subunit D
VKRIHAMNIRIIEKNGESMRFIVDGIDTPLANALRRIMLAEVPSMAIDDVVMIENLSVLPDEILALRLGLIPLKTDLEGYNLPEKCSCQSELGCHLCRTVLTLDVEAKDEIRTVYSGDLVPEDPNITPVSDKVPIVKLAPAQKVRLEAYAKLGKGMTHAKWQPVSASYYRYTPIVKLDSANCQDCSQCADVCPKNVFGKKGDKIKVVNELECILCEDCVRECVKNPPPIKISKKPDSFIFHIESTGALPPERIILAALKIYEEKCSEFVTQLEAALNVPKQTN